MENATILTLVSKECSKGELEPLIQIASAKEAHLSIPALGASPHLD